MSLPKNYVEIAAAIGVYYCVESGPLHDTGYTSFDGGPEGRDRTIHWTERRVTRSGIRRFLVLAYPEDSLYFGAPRWLRIWCRITWVRDQARTLHVSIPNDLWDEDKARLAARLATAVYAAGSEEEIEAKRALRWTRS